MRPHRMDLFNLCSICSVPPTIRPENIIYPFCWCDHHCHSFPLNCTSGSASLGPQRSCCCFCQPQTRLLTKHNLSFRLSTEIAMNWFTYHSLSFYRFISTPPIILPLVMNSSQGHIIRILRHIRIAKSLIPLMVKWVRGKRYHQSGRIRSGQYRSVWTQNRLFFQFNLPFEVEIIRIPVCPTVRH